MTNVAIRAAMLTLLISPVFLALLYVQDEGRGFSAIVFYFILLYLLPAMLILAFASIIVFYIENAKKIFESKIFISIIVALIALLYVTPLSKALRNDTFFTLVSVIFGCLIVCLTMMVTRYLNK
jgi:hypothetical protein